MIEKPKIASASPHQSPAQSVTSQVIPATAQQTPPQGGEPTTQNTVQQPVQQTPLQGSQAAPPQTMQSPTIQDTPLDTLQPASLPQVPPAKAGTNHLILVGTMVGSYLLGFLYLESFLFATYRTHGYWELGFTLCFFAAGELLARTLAKSEGCTATMPAPKEHYFWMACAITIGIASALDTYFIDARPAFWQWNDRYSAGTILIYGNFILHALAAYWVVCRFGWLCRGKTGAWIVVDSCNALIFLPFGSFFVRFKLFWQGVYYSCKQYLAPKCKQKPSVAACLILGVFVAFFWVALSLLQASDTVFAAFLRQFQFNFSWELSTEWGEFLLKFCLSLPVGAYLFGLFSRCMQAKQTPTALEREVTPLLHAAQKLRVLAPATLTAVLGCFIGLYLLYFGVQAEHYLSAFWGNLPERFTFSEYARQGFFELCKLMTLNFMLLGIIAKVSTRPLRSCKGLRAAGYGLLGISLLFAATALAKLILYIKIFGFTDLRLLSIWGITVLVVAVLFAMQTLHKAQPIAHKLIYFAAASFSLLCLLAT